MTPTLRAQALRAGSRVVITAMVAGLLLLVTAAPAGANDCAYLTDCTATAKVGIAAAALQQVFGPNSVAATVSVAAANNAQAAAVQAIENAQAAEQQGMAALRAGDVAGAEEASAEAAAKAQDYLVDANRQAILAQIAGVNTALNPEDAANCAFVMLAVDGRFTGYPLYTNATGLMSGTEWSTFSPEFQAATEQSIRDNLAAAGDGSSGAVYIQWPRDSVPVSGHLGTSTHSHVINVLERGGTTFFVDGSGQSAKVATSLGELYPHSTIDGLSFWKISP